MVAGPEERDETLAVRCCSRSTPLPAARGPRAGNRTEGRRLSRHQSPEPFAERVRAFVQGLAETGQIEGRDVMIEYRWANGNSDKLPALASELARRQPAVIVSAGSVAAVRAAKAATTSIPIVFEVAAEPVETELVKGLTEPISPGGHARTAASRRCMSLPQWRAVSACSSTPPATAPRTDGIRRRRPRASSACDCRGCWRPTSENSMPCSTSCGGAGQVTLLSADPVFAANSEHMASRIPFSASPAAS
jgi:ABC transporter substrate binding protein